MNKNTKLIIFFVVIILAALFLFVREKIQTKPADIIPLGEQVTQFDVTTIQTHSFVDTSNPALEIRGEYPVGVVGAEYIKGGLDTKLTQFKSENDPAKFSAEDLLNFGPTKDRQYSFITQYKAYTNGSFLTHRMDTYTYSGGAHGETLAETYTYTTAGKQITTADLFVDQAAVARFSELVQRKALAMPEYKDMINTEWLAAGAGPNAVDYKAFAFDNKNIIIIFQQYSIAPYAAGIIEVSIPFTELAGIFKPEFLK